MTTTKFQVGDHVRVKSVNAFDGGRHNGKTGVVLSVPVPGDTFYHRVRLDDGTYESLPITATEIEHMPPFKPGDKVQVADNPRYNPDFRGRTLVVADPYEREDCATGATFVRVVGHSGYVGSIHIKHLTLVPADPTPAELPDTYAEQAAALREQADTIRNERDEKYAEIDRLTEEAEALDRRAINLTAAALALEKIK